MNNITAHQIITWQNELMKHANKSGEKYSPVYLRSIHSQLSAIFNHAAKYYGLRENPCKKAGCMGKKKNREMQFWTKEEYLKFAEVMMDKPLSFYAFEMLYWCGIREGELLALTPADFDFEKRTVSITKSYQRLNGQDLITTPKTEKSNRVIQMPQFLVDEIQDYLKQLYNIQSNDRMFTVTKSYLYHEMDRGAKKANIKRIRIHDLRHSHVSLLIDMGFSATAIADRVGHESIDITYNYAHLFPSRQLEMANKLNLERADSMSCKKQRSRNRWRSKTVSFRVSLEENEQLNTFVKLSGMTKQDYIIRCLTSHTIIIQGNPRVYKALKNQLEASCAELQRLKRR